MASTTPLNKADFLGLDSVTWLYTGAESPPYRGLIKAVNSYLYGRTNGPAGRELNAATETKFRESMAQLLNGTPSHIALLPNAPEAISAIVLALRLQPGDSWETI